MESSEFAYYLWFFFRVLFITLIFIFLISGLDDFFLDMVYYVRSAHRWLFRRKLIKPVTREQLNAIPEKPLAMMIPAWDESNIVQRMLLNTAGTLDYKNFYIFVGTYPNDGATAQEVEKAREIFPNIEIVVTPADGPTNKADCLNWIYQGILVFEKEHSIEFEIFFMHDAEDIIHPLWPKFANFLIPRIQFIQLPVFPLDTPWHQFISGVYKDEFAENHTKDMRARELLAETIPSAGVGTAFSRQTLAYLAKERNNQIFDINSLTEDYLMGLLLKDMPGKKIFLQQWVEHLERRENPVSGEIEETKSKQPIATREFFPNSFISAIRQKSRWILGISMQGWSYGWTNSLGANYCLYRDRKSLLMNLTVIVGYIVGIYFFGMFGFNAMHEGNEMPPMIAPGEIYWKLGALVLVFFAWRLINRMVAVWRIYGFGDALLSVPRIFLGNIINFCATVMAIQRFVKARMSGTKPEWGKTEHAWPSEEQLHKYHRKIGDLLVERRVITSDQLDKALDLQRGTDKKLGEVLVEMGAMWEEDLIFTLAAQRNEKAIEIDPYARPDLLDTVPKSVAEKYRIFPVDIQGETLVLATDSLTKDISNDELSEYLARPVTFRITSRADIDFAINRGYRDKEDMPDALSDRLGPRLVREGKITDEQLKQALRKQKRSNQKLGEILVDMELITSEELNVKLEDQQS